MPANTAAAAVVALIALGVSGYAPYSAPPIAVNPERFCLALAIYFEAHGEPRLGQWTVGRVILNRTRLNHYPKTICGVVNQNAGLIHRCQFSFACDGKPNGRRLRAHELRR
jgi:spore germination cell wall hydrolase CwlJ-like protein